MLLVTMVSALVFAGLNFPDGMILVAWIQVAVAAFAAGLLVVVRRTQSLQIWSVCFVLVLLTATVVLLSRPEVSEFAFVWLLVIPLVTHLLLGSRLGLVLALSYMGLGAAIYLYRFGGNAELIRVEVLSNAVIAALTTLGLSHFYERHRIGQSHASARCLPAGTGASAAQWNRAVAAHTGPGPLQADQRRAWS
ncbi:hypothetical protein LPW33_08860 [Ectothiorhodospira variabilis]|nr:hypothetical protein [Ectothiorhodospira variabilis]MCG5493817.1 hypothetical protein [Ectothiorhodospira variabilis]MCG5504016.1 hypothetical protein [Ectothiorhodospira variabilis]MCG5507171.1 hypothetical protein [Ectothiorhodospira variabilis]